MLVGKFGRDLVFARSSGEIRHINGSIFVVLAVDFSLAWAFDGKRKSSCTSSFCRDDKFGWISTHSVSQARAIGGNLAFIQRSGMEFEW